jgi:DNA-binding MarR family transcriptional regulator
VPASVAEEDRLLEQAVFVMALDLHPEHLTSSELARKIAGEEGLEREAVRRTIDELCGSGLLRRAGDVVEPTHAAVRAAELLALP